MPAIATASLLLASGALAQATSHAEQAILIPGAMPFKNINPLEPVSRRHIRTSACISSAMARPGS
jgi:hypothetical protein